MRDFTFAVYKSFLKELISSGYQFQTLKEFIINPFDKVIVLRHDCDHRPMNSLLMAQSEYEMGIKSSYYFRIPETFKHNIIKDIIKLGHEVGYHYEDLARYNGDYNKAIISFKQNLATLRKFYPVETITMHGRPLSKWDSKKIWEKYDFHDFGIICEPNLVIDFNKVLYFTDTGNLWNSEKYNIRDRIVGLNKYRFSNTNDLKYFLKSRNTKIAVIINAHAERWNDNLFSWYYKFILQKSKNFAKQFLKNSEKRN